MLDNGINLILISHCINQLMYYISPTHNHERTTNGKGRSMEPESTMVIEHREQSEKMAAKIVEPSLEKLKEVLPLNGELTDVTEMLSAYKALHDFQRVLIRTFNRNPSFISQG